MPDTPRTGARVAIVTGAARGIGAATALRLAQDGLAVAVLDLEDSAAKASAEAVAAAGGTAVALGADVSDPAAVEAAVARVAEELGPPTVLVNNAGITRDNLLFTMSESDWDAVMNVHLKGSFLMTRTAQKHIQGFTKTLAIELGRFGITANCVAPGFVASDMTKATAERIGVPWEQYVQDRAKAIPVQRAGQVEDIAHAVSFFVDERCGFVSGQVLYVAGGPRT